MGQYEQSKSEARHSYNYKIDGKDFLRIQMSKFFQDQDEAARHKANAESYGTDLKAWGKGLRDRLSASGYSPSQDYYESSLYSYIKGYIDEGNRQISLSITIGMLTEQALEIFYGINDKTYDPKKYGEPSRKEFAKAYLDDFLYAVGLNDGQGIIEFDDLPGIIRKNEAYNQGYNAAHKKKK